MVLDVTHDVQRATWFSVQDRCPPEYELVLKNNDGSPQIGQAHQTPNLASYCPWLSFPARWKMKLALG